MKRSSQDFRVPRCPEHAAGAKGSLAGTDDVRVSAATLQGTGHLFKCTLHVTHLRQTLFAVESGLGHQLKVLL